jgi:hypothetical protein
MKKYTLYVLALSLGIFCGCKKKPLPEPPVEEPVFFVNGMMDAENLDIAAGDNDYYMFSTNSLDTNNTRIFSADLKQSACPAGSCGYGLRVLIKDMGPAVINQPANVETALKPGFYFYNDDYRKPEQYRAKFKPQMAEEPGATYQWTVDRGYGQVVTGEGYEFITVVDASTHTVTMKYFDPTGCEAQHVNIFNPGCALQTTVSAVKSTGASSISYSFSCNTTASNYKWEFGDGSISESLKPVHTYTFLPEGYYKVKLTLENANDTCVTYYQVSGVPDPICLANFNAEFEPLPLSVLYSRVTVLLTDPSGVVYSSGKLRQPQESRFEIISSEPYLSNEKGESTRKLRVRFNCVLSNGSQQRIMQNGEASIAVSF